MLFTLATVDSLWRITQPLYQGARQGLFLRAVYVLCELVFIVINGLIAQLVEHPADNGKVDGSNPSKPIG